eukprot:g27792.t1
MAPKKGRSVQLAMEEATSEEVRRADSQEPLRDATSSGAGASPVDMAVIWVKKAAKGSTQWTDIGTKRQLSHYKFRKRLKPLTVLIKNQLQTFYRKQSYSIDRAFQLLADHSAPPGLNTRHARAGPNELAERDPELVGSEEQDREAGISLEKWMDFFTTYCVAATCIGSKRDHSFVQQQALQTFQALDSDGSSCITKDEFKLVVHVLSDPQIYIPLRPLPEASSTTWGRRLRFLFQKGIAWRHRRLPWWMVVDFVVFLETRRETSVFVLRGLLLFLVYYIFATVGVQLFGGLIDVHNPNLDHTGFAEAQYWPLNFNDFLSALVTLFCLMVVNNWYVVADGFMAVTSNYSAIFFVCFFVSVNLVVLNILMTLILESSATVRHELSAKTSEDDAPQRSWSRGAREFFLQRMLLSEEERGRHVCAFPSHLEAKPARLVQDLEGGDFFRQIRFQPEGALHLPLLQVMRLPSWGLNPAVDPAPPVSEVALSPVASRASRLPRAKLADAEVLDRGAPQAMNFMDLVKDFNEGQGKLPNAKELSESDLLLVHQDQAAAEDTHSALLAKVAAQNPRARAEATRNDFANNILNEL